MDKKSQPGRLSIERGERRIAEAFHGGGKFFVGIDIGSTSSDVVIIDEGGRVVFDDYRRTMGRPIETVREQLALVFKRKGESDFVLFAATGTAGRFFASLAGIPFVNEVPAQAAAIGRLYPDFEHATIIEMGGQDSKLIFISRQDGRSRVRDFALNTVCAAGTGSFLDQQAQRLGIDIEGGFGELALQSRTVPRMAGRCSVFAKSDMIHLQQQATPNCDIVAGLCLALARNLKSNLGCGREFVKPIVFTGGVAANIGVVRALENVFELEQDELVVPVKHFFTGAIGAVLVAKGRERAKGDGKLELAVVDDYLKESGSALKQAPRRPILQKPKLPPPVSRVYEELLVDGSDGPIDAYLGVDVGSISTNVAVIDEQKRVLAKAYLMTAGKPLEAVRQGLDIVGRKVVGKVNILGAATTGSGRYLTGDFIGADIVINEITAQAAGAAIVNPKVDTIFEIGGQDSKYISLENGVVVDFEMNHACAAGTGSFLEEQAQRLDIKIEEEFAEKAFASDGPIKLGERCTVFMESDLLSYQQQGACTEDLVAGLSYSIVANYLNRVVGRRRVGNNICFQGGTAFNKAVWSAFEQVTGKPIMVPDHHEVTGAIGAAAIAAEHMKNKGSRHSTFRGFENIVHIEYSVESFNCEHCPNNCEIKKVQLPDSEPLYYGSRCDRYNIKKKESSAVDLGAFEYRTEKMFEYAGLSSSPFESQSLPAGKKRVGIPLALIGLQLLPMFSRFFKALGFEVVHSGKTNKRIIRKGVESVTAQTCYPVKVAYGHVLELIEKGVDYIFLPSIVSMTANFPENKHSQLCPYVQTLCYQIQTAFADRLGKTEILTVPIRLGEGDKLLYKTFGRLGKKLGVSGRAIRRAVDEAVEAQSKFEQSLRDKGAEILGNLKPDERLFVLVSRPYNGCDDGVNLEVPKKLAELGVKVIPMEMLDLSKAKLSDEYLHRSVYWAYGQKILRAAEIIKDDERLFAIYLSSFSCGPDSFLMTFFRDIMLPKPGLQLEIDEHSADAGVITRLEAYLESLKHYSPQRVKQRRDLVQKQGFSIEGGRKWYIPYMGDSSFGLAAALRAYGQPAEVMPLADEAALIDGRSYTSGKECLPCAITTGDMLKVVKSEGFEPRKVGFFMPTAGGPCRFGMYNCLHRQILRYVDCEEADVIAPNQDSSFYTEFAKIARVKSITQFSKDLWISVVGLDLLRKVILRLRPFAVDSNRAERLYRDCIRRWEQAVERRSSLSEMRALMEVFAEDFSALELDQTAVKPRVGIVGEIYVRSHPFANDNVIGRLEALGAVCDLAPLAEWIYYTNFTRARMARRRGQWKNLLTNLIQNFFQHKLEKSLARPLERRFGALAEEPVEKTLGMASPYIHNTLEGEAILSVGKTVEYYHQGVGGVVNVMPFTCMPSTIVSTQTRRISADCDDMPILNLSFDGQEDSTLTTRLEAFVEQVRQRHSCNVSVAELTAV